MDKIVYLCIYYFEKLGYKFVSNSGKSVVVSLDGDDEYYWFPASPYKIHHRQQWKNLDAYSEITKLNPHKSAWQDKCHADLDELLNRDCKFTYQIQVNTQDLEAHKEDVTNFLNNYKILKISSPMATRKSNVIEEVVNQTHQRGERVLFITNRVSLSLDIADKYNLKHYQRNDYITGDSLVVQFDSLSKFTSEFDNFDVVILDEITSLLLYMSSTYKGKEEKYISNIYSFMSLNYKKFVIADSFIIDFPFEGKTLGIYNNFRENLKVREYLDKYKFVNKIMQTVANGLISVSSNEKKFLINIKTMLEKRGKRVLLLTADTENKEEIYSIFQNTTIEYDAILFSPTLTVGVSIFSKVGHHFHYDTSGTVSVIDSIQMTRRSREAKNIHYFIRGKSSFKETSIINIERTLRAFHIPDDWNNFVKITYAGKKLARIKQMRNIFDNTHKYAFKALLEYQFDDVTIVTESSQPFTIG